MKAALKHFAALPRRNCLRARTGGGLAIEASLPWRSQGRTSDLQATNPAVYGSKRKSKINSICDFDCSLELAGPRNRRKCHPINTEVTLTSKNRSE
jgi:hypothetical protein